MRHFSATWLSLVLFLAVSIFMGHTLSAQQKQAPTRQPKKNATAQKNASSQKSTVAQKSQTAGKPVIALDMLPEGVLGFGVVRNLEELDAKISALAQDLQVPAPGALLMLRTLSGIQEGLDEKGALVAAALPGDEGPPLVILYVPVSDYQKFIGQLQPQKQAGGGTVVTIANQTFAAMQKGNYAALTNPESAARLKEIVSAKGRSINLPAGLSAWAANHDAYLVVMPDAIKRAIGPARQGLQQAKAAFPADNEQLQAVVAMFDVYDKMLSTIETEITHFGLGVRIDQGTIYLNSHSVFLPDGSLAQAAKDAVAPAQHPLAALPAGNYAMAFDGVIPEAWLKGMSKFSAQAMRMMAQPGGQKITDEQIQKLTETMQESMRGLESMAFRIGTLQPGKSIYASMSGVMKVKSPRDFMARYEKSIKAMSEALGGNPLFGSYKITKDEVSGVPTLQISMDLKAMMGAAGAPNAEQVLKLLLGEEDTVTAYVAPADATTVVMAYSKEGLSEALNAATKKTDSFTSQPEIAATMKLLPKDSQWLAFFNPRGMVEFGQAMAKRVSPDSQVQLPQFPMTPPLGIGARMTEKGCETSLVAPKELLVAIGAYVQKMQQGAGAGGQQ